MNNNCLQGNTWSFDSTFLFVGSVATTIGSIQMMYSTSCTDLNRIYALQYESSKVFESKRLWECNTKN